MAAASASSSSSSITESTTASRNQPQQLDPKSGSHSPHPLPLKRTSSSGEIGDLPAGTSGGAELVTASSSMENISMDTEDSTTSTILDDGDANAVRNR